MRTAEPLAARFAEDGFVEIPAFVAPETIAALRDRAGAIVDGFDPTTEGAVFSTRDDAKTKAEAYFLTSGDAVRCFFEEEAFDERGALRAPKHLAINKIGHALHDLDPVFAPFANDPRIGAIARELGLSRPRVMQSMYIFKQPHIGGEVRWHQDATYFVTEPQTVTTFWFALERATRENGCLWAQRGGHRTPLRERFRVENGVPRMQALDATPWPDATVAEPLEVDAGTLLVFHGLLPHYSAPNRSSTSRHAFTLHVVDAAATYAAENWLQRG